VQNRDFALGAVDGVVNQVELDLELFALLDLGAIGFQQRVRVGDLARDRRFRCRSRGAVAGPAIWARIARSSAMISRCIGPASPSSTAGIGHWRVAQNGLFDTKTFAMTDMRFFPPLHSVPVLDRCDLT
jgi:hypothetical protein